MSTTTQIDQVHPAKHARTGRDKRLFNLIFATGFVVFVVGFGIARVLPVSGSVWTHDNKNGRGVIEKARAEANMLASFALMH